jgi:hypothetical protein
VVIGEIDKVIKGGPASGDKAVKVEKPAAAKPEKKEIVCPHCAAKFQKNMKFCGECGKAMA